MIFKTYSPTTPGFRHRKIVLKQDLYKKTPFKKLTKGISKSGGRNNYGRITVQHIGGGYKRKLRLIDFKRNIKDCLGQIIRIEYDPIRTANILLIKYVNTTNNITYRYIIAPQDMHVGETVVAGTNVEIKKGNTIPLKNIPIGTKLHNLEYIPGKGGQLIRSAGTFGILKKKDANAHIQMPSGYICIVPIMATATIGAVSNAEYRNIIIGKAGFARKLGIRPTVRGVAMNPVDHPHGGGHSKSLSPYGIHTKGKKTRSSKKPKKHM